MGQSFHSVFENWVSSLKINYHSPVLSVSTGDGIWDFIVFKIQPKIKRIVATDIISNPVARQDRRILRQMGDWQFVKVAPGKTLPFPDRAFDLIYHLDVIEHVNTPHLFISDQFRLLRPGGFLIVGTPNLHRLANIFKLLTGKLIFPALIGSNNTLGDYIHVQEYTRDRLRLLLIESGFKIVSYQPCFFGIHQLNISFEKYPVSKIGQALCQYYLFLCQKT